nr:thiamine pyrophosphate-dependent enzyme [Vulcanisaeta moutnovskia]
MTISIKLARTVKDLVQMAQTEYFDAGHRTCQGCESAMVLRWVAKAAGPNTIVIGATGCMYVANTTYYTTAWALPWIHTQLSGTGSAAVGTAAALKALMEKGKLPNEKINVIGICGDLGCADAGLSEVSNALTHTKYNFLILMYDNESSANTDIQETTMTPFGALTTFSPSGKQIRIMKYRWKKNMAAMMAVGHPEVKYVATAMAADPIDLYNKVRKALEIGGPTFIHTLDPCPKGWGYDPKYSHEIGKLAVETGLWPLFEIENGKFRLTSTSARIASGEIKRKPVKEYIRRQTRFKHLTDEDIEYIQRKVDEMWEKWLIPGLLPLTKELPYPETTKAQ